MLQEVQRAAVGSRNPSRRSLQSSWVGPFLRALMVSHITEIGVEPNSAIAHGRYLGRTLNSAGPADCPVLLRRRSERRAMQDLMAWHRRARRSARRKRAPGRDKTSNRPAGSEERAPSRPTECARDTRSKAR